MEPCTSDTVYARMRAIWVICFLQAVATSSQNIMQAQAAYLDH